MPQLRRPRSARGPNATVGAGLTPQQRELWLEAFDPKITPVKQFIELFEVQTKRVQESGTVMVDFAEREAQIRLREAIEAEWAKGHGAKIVVLKDRQQGISEWICRFFLERMLRGGGGHARQISHKDQATEDLLQRARLVKDQIPPAALELIGARVESEKADRGFSFRFGTHLISSLEILTARDDALGRGGAVRWIHLSEYPWWKAGKDKLDGLLESWDDVPGNCVIFESTGRTFDEFYDICTNAKEGRSGYVFLFFSWLTHPQKKRPFQTKRRKTKFCKSLGRIKRYGPDEELTLRDQHGASPEQLNWRRNKIDSPSFNGDLAKFRREHPTVWTDAFLSTSMSLYDPSTVRAWMPLGEQMEAECLIGDLMIGDDQEVEFHEQERAWWRIFHPPTVGTVYAWGADPAEGKTLHADGKTEGDFSVIQIREVLSKRIVAICSGHIAPEEFATEIIKGALFYGRALGYVEANNHGHTVISSIEMMEYGELLLTRMRLTPTDTGKRWTRAPGFLSKRDTKPRAVDRSRKWVRELGLPKPGSEPAIPASLLLQMQRYVRLDEHGQRMGASSGHDDEVSADYLCHEAVAMVEPMVDKVSSVEEPMTDFERYVMREDKSLVGAYMDKDLGLGF